MNNIGENIKSFLLLLQVLISFATSLRPSANGCPIPNKPTTAGPRRRCIAAKILRSKALKKLHLLR